MNYYKMKKGDIVYLKEKYESSDGFDVLNIEQGYELRETGPINSIVWDWSHGNTLLPTKLLMSKGVYDSIKRGEKIYKLINQ